MARRSDVPDAELDDALALLHFAFRAITAEADAALEARGMGRVHHRILYFVRRSPSLSVGDLLATLAITKQSLHGPLQDLMDAGYLTSTRRPTNRRTKELALTRAGLAFERSLSGPQRTMFARAFAEAPRGAAAWRKIMFELGGRRAKPSGRDADTMRGARSRANDG